MPTTVCTQHSMDQQKQRRRRLPGELLFQVAGCLPRSKTPLGSPMDLAGLSVLGLYLAELHKKSMISRSINHYYLSNMWDRGRWVKFLTEECEDYPVEYIEDDAQLLSNQHIGSSQFAAFIEQTDRNFSPFLQSFPSFTFGRFLALIGGMKKRVRPATVPQQMEDKDPHNFFALSPWHDAWSIGKRKAVVRTLLKAAYPTQETKEKEQWFVESWEKRIFKSVWGSNDYIGIAVEAVEAVKARMKMPKAKEQLKLVKTAKQFVEFFKSVPKQQMPEAEEQREVMTAAQLFDKYFKPVPKRQKSDEAGKVRGKKRKSSSKRGRSDENKPKRGRSDENKPKRGGSDEDDKFFQMGKVVELG